MEEVLKNKKTYLVLCVLCVVALVAALAACSPASNTGGSTDNAKEEAAETPEVQTPDPDEFGVVDAKSWAEIYPDQYDTYQENLVNKPGADKLDYLEVYPAMKTLYAGYGFSKGYDQAASHLYSLESINATPRVNEKTLANCITCKSPQFTALVNKNGVSEYSQPFAETIAKITEPISCYNCHENNPEELTVGNQFFVTALGSDVSKVDLKGQVCGQCHNEYYFNPEDKAVTNPYTGLAQMTPEAMLAYYDEKGFKDWEYPVTGTPMLKAQHPEFETFYGGDAPGPMSKTINPNTKETFACADCHMGQTTTPDGNSTTSHFWTSPLENQDLIDNTCSSCHDDIKGKVADIQTAYSERVQAISLKLEDMANKMTAQVEAGTLTGDALAQLQTLHRSSQWYWDFVVVENSNGAHNSALANKTLDKSEELVDQALAML